MLGHHPVLQQVGDPGWHPEVVFEHVDRAVAVADEIAPADVRPDRPRGVYADALAAEVGRAGDQLRGDDAGADHPLLVVDVVDEQVECVEALDEAGLDGLPLLTGDDPGDDVEGPGAVEADRAVVDGEGHPDGPDLTLRGLLAFDRARPARAGRGGARAARRPDGGARRAPPARRRTPRGHRRARVLPRSRR